MIPLCADQGVKQIVWSPQAKGRLARKPGTVTQRYENEAVGKRFFPEDESNLEIIRRVEKVAEDKGIPMGQVALSWLLSKPTVAAPIVGATKITHLEEACGAVDVTLTEDEVKYLEEWMHCHDEESAKQQFWTSLERTGAGYFDYYLLHALQRSNYHFYED